MYFIIDERKVELRQGKLSSRCFEKVGDRFGIWYVTVGLQNKDGSGRPLFVTNIINAALVSCIYKVKKEPPTLASCD